MGYSRCGIIFGSVLLALVCGCASYYDYACPEAPDGYMVVDSYANGRAYDWIKVENRLPDRIDVFVIEHDAKGRKWRDFANASILPGEDVELEPKPKRRLKENRYYAVLVPGVESKCISHDVKSNDLYLYVGDECEACRQYVDYYAKKQWEAFVSKWTGASYADVVTHFGPGDFVEEVEGAKMLSYKTDTLRTSGGFNFSASYSGSYSSSSSGEYYGSGRFYQGSTHGSMSGSSQGSGSFSSVTRKDISVLWFMFDKDGKVTRVGRSER